MCGFAGFRFFDGSRAECALGERMANKVFHRGPDDSGVWCDTKDGIVLAHRRLSILDLSPAGKQPMHSACERYVIVFNGEIYNWPELKSDLESTGHIGTWKGYSDTEVLLAAVSKWGISRTLSKARGMFAFALWDRKEKSIVLARDRVGEKPLYYGKIEGAFIFGSELKALKPFLGWESEIDIDALALFIRYGYVPAPYSIYKGIFKLEPGCIVRIMADGSVEGPKRWWDFQLLAESGVENCLSISDEQSLDMLEDVLCKAISEQMIADVPLGALLSGGIDSSIIVAIMQSISNQPVRTFTIGFEEKEYNEALYAKHIARHIGTEHTELFVTNKDALQVITHLPDIYDEPFADASQIPTYLVCALTRQHVTVCLSGDAGDELFGGYNRYFWAESIWKKIGKFSKSSKKLLADSMSSFSAAHWDKFFKLANRFLPSILKVSNPGDKIHKLKEVIGADSQEELFRLLASQWRGPLPLESEHDPVTIINNPSNWPKLRNFIDRMMAIDTVTYLPDDILVKVDRAAMANSLETRLPFLDKRVIEFAWQLPLDQKIRNKQGKWLLKQLLYRYVPRGMVERPKQGFSIPLEYWLRGPLRDWAEELLSMKMLKCDPILDADSIRAKWKDHLEGRNYQYALWNILMYQAWKIRWM